MLMSHPEIEAPTTTLTDIIAVLGEYTEGNMHIRCTFVDHFRYFKTDEPNGLGGFIYHRRRGHRFNPHTVNEYLDSHLEISKWDFMNLLDEEADLVDDYWERGNFDEWED